MGIEGPVPFSAELAFSETNPHSCSYTWMFFRRRVRDMFLYEPSC